MKTQLLIESLDLSEAVIDADKRTVRQKIIAAGKSRNGRYYSEAVLEKAASLFQGVQTYANHPSRADMKDRPERSVLDITGFITDVTYEGGVIKGTRHFVGDAGEKVWKLVEQVVNGSAPASLVGASINAVGKGRKGKQDGEDVLIVEAIDAVNSVDDVTSPAAGGGWERLIAGDASDLTTQLLASVDYDEWCGVRPEYVEKLKREWKKPRQDEAVKAANAAVNQLQLALTEAQTQIELLVSERDAALLETGQARRELALEKALRLAKLPLAVENDLRTRLMESALDRWTSIIQAERTKLKALGHKPRIEVTGGGQQIAPAVPRTAPAPRYAPIDMSKINSPEELQRELRKLQGGQL